MDVDTNWFQIFHTYNDLAARSAAKEIKCHQCDLAYIVGRSDAHDGVVLRCYSCGDNVTPGIYTLEHVRSVVREHHL